MSAPIFLDANVLAYATADPDSPLGGACGGIVAAIGDGRLEARSSVAVLEELWHLELRGRPAGLEGATADAYELLTPLLAIDDEAFAGALALDAAALGANDRIHVATCLTHGIDTVVSADADFDAVADLTRIDPLDAQALSAIVAREPSEESPES